MNYIFCKSGVYKTTAAAADDDDRQTHRHRQTDRCMDGWMDGWIR
jgi:hypothetical protein